MDIEKCKNSLWAITRISLGLIFLWAFIDKVFGLGFATCRNSETHAIEFMCSKAWLNGGSPTTGFLKFASHGPFKSVFNAIAGSTLVDWLFMLGLLGVGIALTLGILMNLGTYSGALMLLLMWLAAIPPEHHPFLDEHLIYIFVLLLMNKFSAGDILGLGKWWKSLSFVKNKKILQ